jgi:hypothetical protein
MSENISLCAIIPVHKPQLSADEVISLKACKKQLNNYKCFLVYPAGMDISAYMEIHNGLIANPVDPAWLSSVEQYNKLKLSLYFYRLFSTFTYMLTYELDAYIFNADIEATNAFSFDFIGAPFFECYWDAKPDSPFIKGCNSGFSIRNIQACIRALEGMKKYRLHWLVYKIFLSRISIIRIKLNQLTHKRYDAFFSGRFGFYFAGFHINEDVVWTEVVPELFPWYRIADPISALKFSFEYNLQKSLKINDGKLPLGCHAWYKHMDFWKNYIDTQQHEI